jgi:hypothetical protein
MRSLSLTNQAGRRVNIISYVSGHLAMIANQQDPDHDAAVQASALARLSDRVDPACYASPDPAAAFDFCQMTIQALQTADPMLPIFPIFSSESEFMGPWLMGIKTAQLDAAETAFNAAAVKAGGGASFSGFQYYEYGWLSRFIGSTTTPVPAAQH